MFFPPVSAATIMHDLASCFKDIGQTEKKLLSRRRIAKRQIPIAQDAPLFQPRSEFRRRFQPEYLAYRGSIVIARRLVVEHHVISARDTHEIVAAGGGEQEHEIIGRVLVRDGVV